MSHLDMKTLYALQLTPEEFRLIGLALAGKLKESETQQAAQLNVRLQQLRLKQVELTHRVCEDAYQRAAEDAMQKAAVE